MGDGAAATTGNVQNITGSGICSGMEFDYPWKSEADGYVDDFSANGGEIIFISQDSKGRVGCYTGPSDNYRTITSSVFFSVLEEDATTRQELMAAYMDFFTGGTSIAGEGSGDLFTTFVSAVSPAVGSFSATVVLQGTASCDLGLYDVTGRKVGTVVSGSLSQGTHNLTVSGAGFASGTYLISGTVGNEQVRLRTVLLK
ncbi:MAG: hypothetical protein KAR40_16605 [Candidatus Sabulitectum sp.]|nr:hypothetical protein [Candidatus Sabulitectum sp.]